MPKNNNPEGKGGFKDNPQNRNPGGWKGEDSISYCYNLLLRLSIEDFKKYTPETMAQEIAYQAIKEASSDLPYLKEVTDRTEGKARQAIDHTSGGDKITQPPISWEKN